MCMMEGNCQVTLREFEVMVMDNESKTPVGGIRI